MLATKKILGIFLMLFISINGYAQSESKKVLFKLKDNLSAEDQAKLDKILNKHRIGKSKKRGRKGFKTIRSFGPEDQSINKSALSNNDDDFNNIELTQELNASGLVKFAEIDEIQHEAEIAITDEYFEKQWHLQQMNVPQAWNDFTFGDEEVIVAVCDSGVAEGHEDLKMNLLPGHNIINGGSNVSPGTSHGTMVAGMIGASLNGKGVVGVAPMVKILPLKISYNGTTATSTIVKCIEYAADAGAHIVNISYTGVSSNSVNEAAIYARNKGTLVIYSAGNDGRLHSSWPDWESVTVIGASDKNDNKASYSAYGPYVDLLAPGNSITSTAPYINNYNTGNGTSYAAPIAAGVAALIFSINPDFTPEEVESFLKEGAIDMGNSYQHGHGRINAYESLDLAAAAFSGNRKPKARFKLATNWAKAPYTLLLDASDSFDKDGEIVQYLWEVNGVNLTGRITALSLDQAGSYNIKLTVVDNGGETRSVEKTFNLIGEEDAFSKVSQMDMSISYSRKWATATGEVLVTTKNGLPMPGVVVKANWNKSVSLEATTDEEGIATFTSPTWRRKVRFYLNIESVDSGEIPYDKNLNEKDSANIRARQLLWRRIFGL